MTLPVSLIGRNGPPLMVRRPLPVEACPVITSGTPKGPDASDPSAWNSSQ